MVSHFRHVDLGCIVPFRSRCARLCPPRTEAAIPLSVSVRDGHVSVSAGFAHLADRSPARIRPPLLASHVALIPNPSSGALHAPDADANHGSQVGPTKLHRTDSKTSHPSLPVEPTLRL